MSIEENKSIARRAYESINEAFRTGNVQDMMKGIAAETMVNHDAMPGQKPDLEGTRNTIAMIRSAFPDNQLIVEDLIAEGDRVVARIRQTGTNTGSFMGRPPTGKQVTFSGIEIMRIQDGSVVERWGLMDNMSILQQLGMMTPAPGPH